MFQAGTSLILCGLSILLVSLDRLAYAQTEAAGPAAKFVDTSAPHWQALKLTVTEPPPLCASVNEPRQIRFSANKAFYLWAYWRDQTGRARMLLPSVEQPVNSFDAERQHDFRLLPDRSGTYELVLVASTEPLALAPQLMTVSNATRITQAFTELGIVIDETGSIDMAQSDQSRNVQVQRLAFQVPVTASTINASTPRYSGFDTTEPQAFVQLDRASYRLDEPFRMIYGATATGYVRILLQQTDGSIEVLLQQAVEAARIYQTVGKAVEPLGRQTLLIQYLRETPDKAMPLSRGLVIGNHQPNNIALFGFEITE